MDQLALLARGLVEVSKNRTLFRGCRELGLKVALVGDGADELLGGFTWYRGEGDRMARVLRQGRSPVWQRFATWLLHEERAETPELLQPELRRVVAKVNPVIAGWSEIEAEVAHRHPLDRMIWLESRTRFVDFCNSVTDRLSMAESVEARPVFLDSGLWDYVARLRIGRRFGPVALGAIEKRLLRDATRSLVPEPIRQRRKWGLAVPGVGNWCVGSTLPEWADEVVRPKEFEDVGIFDAGRVAGLRAKAARSDPTTATLLYRVLYTQLWARTLLRGEPGALD
ncbi:MAG: asparagine synthase C-terminal domain-containing protein [Acidobacteriota bacterium]|nr:asparagine synthase C-terminal domain-containing protein [Acidobacteriota bacterium]